MGLTCGVVVADKGLVLAGLADSTPDLAAGLPHNLAEVACAGLVPGVTPVVLRHLW